MLALGKLGEGYMEICSIFATFLELQNYLKMKNYVLKKDLLPDKSLPHYNPSCVQDLS
jgi:hypothetical protein